jgi:hypothetical protein
MARPWPSRLFVELISTYDAERIARGHLRLAERKPWGEAVAAYLAYGEVHKDPATVAEDRRSLTKRFVPPEAVRFVDELRAQHVEAYVAVRKAAGSSQVELDLIHALAILEYLNGEQGEQWVDIHPMVKPLLDVWIKRRPKPSRGTGKKTGARRARS